MALEDQNMSHTLTNLRNCTIRLYGAYKDTVQKQKTDDHMFWQQAGAEEWSESESADQYLEGGKKGRKPSRNRPGMEQLAITKTGASMNMPNQ